MLILTLISRSNNCDTILNRYIFHVAWLISFQMYGEEFRPSQVRFNFSEQHDPGVMGRTGRYRGKPVPYGSADYDVPHEIPVKERIAHLVQIMEPLLPALRAAGATEWHISIGRYYWGQCNEEYSFEDIQMISRLGCGFTYSAYQVTEEEEQKLNQKY